MKQEGEKMIDPIGDAVLAVILGGGRGIRLAPLTLYRSKPAVPFGAKYRLVDIPVSNCINSGIHRIFVLTQYNSFSLNRHISRTYRFSLLSPQRFVEIIAAEQTMMSEKWFQGTADAVRQVLHYCERYEAPYVLILAGDHLYRMNYRDLFKHHLEIPDTHLTIPTVPKPPKQAHQFGIMRTGKNEQIIEFKEKPEDLVTVKQLLQPDGSVLASMGIYLFNTDVLIKVLDNDFLDFGKEIVPEAIKQYNVRAYVFKGYWEDIGTIKAFHRAHQDLLPPIPKFQMYSKFGEKSHFLTHARYLPASQISHSTIHCSLIAEGCIIEGASITNSTVGIRSIVREGTEIYDSIIIGNDFYETLPSSSLEVPHLGIGENCVIRNAIIDKQARIGDGVVIENKEQTETFRDPDERYWIRDGIVVIPREAVLPNNFVI
jgi:glucose-1-phosphate adenylyltransferase